MDADILNKFHESYFRGNTWQRTSYFGVPTQKCPLDLWIYQELIYRLKPDLIIETGTFRGGSALCMAHLLDQLGKGQLVTVDVKELDRPQHERITYLLGSSTSEGVVAEVSKLANAAESVLVILDSAHNREHVERELELYNSLVKPVGSYLIVEDTNHAIVRKGSDNHPGIATKNFLAKTDKFRPDPECEKFYMTFNPGGYLRRVK